MDPLAFMPYPRNVQTAMLVEKTVRDNGAVPATIGIIDGEITIGMRKARSTTYEERLIIVKDCLANDKDRKSVV